MGLGQDDILKGKNMKQLSRVTNLALMGFSVVIGSMSFKLGIGNPSNMGPGFMPFVACILLFCSLSVVLVLELKTKKEKEEMDSGGWNKPIGVCLALLGYTFLLQVIGYPMIAFVTTFALSYLMAPRRWVSNAVFSGSMAAVTYTVFNWFGLGLPSGVFGVGW
jgi:hypothetical protein